MGLLARLSLGNRALILLITLASLLFGAIATTSAERELIPDIDVPMAIVTAEYQGASPEVVENEVTTPLEQAVRGVAGVTDYRATSSTGSASIVVEFDYDDTTDEVVRSVQRSVDQARPFLPDDVEPMVLAFGVNDIPVVMLAASAPDGDEQAITESLENLLIPELEAISGVRGVQLSGVRETAVVVTPDEDELEEHNLGVPDLVQALRSTGDPTPGGNVTSDGQSLTVTTGERLTSLEEVEDIWLTPGADPQPAAPTDPLTAADPQAAQAEEPEPIQLTDVAEVELRPEARTGIARTDGNPSLGIIVTQSPDGNTVEISEAVHATIADLEPVLGSDIEVSVVFDQAPFINSSIEAMGEEGGLALVAALLVILAFLLSVRSTLVTAVSIPTSLLIGMIGIQVLDFSLNMLTLAALTVSVGRVVDDSIVVLENIKRHLGYGEERLTAVYTGVREVATAVSSSTFITIAVFLPVAFVGGQAGELFRPFSITVSIALAASLTVALTIVPVLAYWFLPRRDVDTADAERARAEEQRRELRTPLQRAYVPLIRWALRWRWTTVALAIGILTGSLALAPMLRTNLIDDMGQNSFLATQELEPGTSLEEAEEEATRVETVLARQAWVESYQSSVSGDLAEAAITGAGTSTVQYTITTDPEGDQTDYRNRLRDLLADVDTEHEVVLSEAVGFASDLEVQVHAEDNATLTEAAEEVERAVDGLDGLSDVENSVAAAMPALRVDVDGEAAAEHGLTESDVGQAVNEAFQGATVGTVTLDEVRHDLLVRGDDAPDTVGELADVEIGTPIGDTVPLDELAEVSEVEEPPELTRSAGTHTATVSAIFTGDDLGAVTARIEAALADVELPDGAVAEIGGASAEQEEAFQQLYVAMLAAVAIVYLILVATFKSLVQPLILLVSIPFAATGVIGLLLLTGTSVGLPALVGMLMLIGIVVSNAIVLIDLVNQYRGAGVSLVEAVVEGARHRLRPILMTSLATMGALTPMALGITGGGAFVSQSLAIVTIGGLATSTLLTLVLVPVLYTLYEGGRERWLRRRREARARTRT